MELKIKFRNKIDRLKELWEYKIFRYTIILHGIYFIISLILTLTIFRIKNDFLVYYTVGKIFVTDINDLYNRANYLWPFRYLPLSAVIFIPFYLLGFDLGFIVFNIFNLVFNILISLILYKLIILIRGDDHEKNEKRVITYICIYFLSLPQIFNYILGQINLYIVFLILLSLFLYLKHENIKWQFIAGLILGITIIIKPITIFMTPFLILLKYDFKRKKFIFNFLHTISRLGGVILPISLNLIIFLSHPSLLDGFIDINLVGEDTLYVNHSFSLTKIIQNLLFFIGIPETSLLNLQILIFIAVLMIIGGLGFVIYIFRGQISDPLIYGYTLGILIMLIAYFDSWDHHLLILTPFLILIIFNLPRNSDITKRFIKPSFFFFNFFDLLFMGIAYIWFHFNFESTIFLLLIFYGICKFCLSTRHLLNRDDLE
ncbi:MAG: glycosyltransferase 87 family protein [Promethearchaeota archaeon]